MTDRTWLLAAIVMLLTATPAAPAALRLTPADTALLFGGTDAEGGIGDWYLTNGVVEAIIDDVGLAADLVGVVPPGSVPAIQSGIGLGGGTLIDLGRVGESDDQLSQLLTIGGLSFENFAIYASISAPSADTIRVGGGILFPPISTRPTPCLAVVTDYTAAGSDPFLTLVTTATNGCGAPLPQFGGFLDVIAWTLRANVPFSGGGVPPAGGKGFDHAELDVSNPATAIESMMFMGAPGTVGPADGVMDPANGTVSGEASYGIVGVSFALDPDGGGLLPPVVTPVDSLVGVSSVLATAVGHVPLLGSLAPGASLTYTRHVYVAARNDVRSVANGMLAELAPRVPFATGTISGDVDAADTPAVEASLVVTRVGTCQASPSTPCKSDADCAGAGPCIDPVTVAGLAPGAAMTHVRTDPAGTFTGVLLPQGHYEVRVSAVERDDALVSPVVVGAGDTPVAIPALTARGTFAFSIREKARGLPGLPAKLTLKGVSPTPDPRFHRDLAATVGGVDVHTETFGGAQAGSAGHAAAQGNVVYTATGTGAIALRPGTYDVYASRGMEYSVALRRVTVPSGGTAAADFRLKRAVRTRNALSADFHVHSGRSFDASAPLRDRVAAFAAEGVEVMVSSDHDRHVDYAPVIAGLALAPRLRSIVGNEVTGTVPNPPHFPSSIGHINGWPVTVAKDAHADGAVQDEFVAPNWIFKRLRDAGAEVIQYNHPRAGAPGDTSIGILNNIGCNRCDNDIDTTCSEDTDCPLTPAPGSCTCVGYQPDRPIAMAPNDILLDDGVLGPGTAANPAGITNLDFDVIEVLNGTRDVDFPGLRTMRRDWFSLLNQGIFKPGTGVSDSHRITVEHAGWARTFVFGAGDDPAGLDPAAFNARVKAGAMVMSSGPYLEVTARARGAAGPGGLVASHAGRVRLRISVRTPAWIPVEEVRVIANGFQVAAFDATTSPRVRAVPANFQRAGGTARFRASLPFTFSQDTYLVVEAGAKLPADPEGLPARPPIVDIIEPDVVPIAISNPIFVDVDGDAAFDPPGLPVMPLAVAVTPALADAASGERGLSCGEDFSWRRFAIPPEAIARVREAAPHAVKPGPVAPAAAVEGSRAASP